MNTVLLRITLAISLLTICQTSYSSGMQSQLDNIFLEMENYSPPGAYETQRRSAFLGGRYTYKTQIVDQNLVSMKLPSARGGCGGIDVFGGSFSFVNSDQIVQLLRAVAANAKGYAFQLAMDNMCPDCMKWMNELQTKLQKMNDALSNSCQLAQGIVNDTFNAAGWKEKEANEHSITGTLSGIGDDFGDLKKSITQSSTAAERSKDSDPDKFNESTGSVVYKALTQHNAQNWFTNGDDDLIETIMSMTGTVVVGDLEDGKDNQGKTTKIWSLPGNMLEIVDLMEGAQNKQIYNCDADDETDYCRIAPSDTEPQNIEGLKEKILQAFTGPTGLINRIRMKNVNAALTDSQKNIIAGMPHSIGSKIFTLAPLSPDAAVQLVEDSIDSITLEYIHRFIEAAFSAVDIALANHESTYKEKAMQEIEKSRKLLRAEYDLLTWDIRPIAELEEHYSSILKNINKPKYITNDSNKQKR